MRSTLRHALRALARTPVLTAVAVLSLALGFGANTAVLSMVRQLLLRPLAVPEAQRLVNLGAPADGTKYGQVNCGDAGDCDAVFSYPMYRDLAAAPPARTRVAAIAAHAEFDASLSARGRSVNAAGALVSGTYFGVLGLTPALGRLLAPDDERPGAPLVAVVSHAYWVDALDADPAAVGRTILVNGRAATLVGVAPPGFSGTTLTRRAAVFAPITARTALLNDPPEWLTDRRYYGFYLFARLAPGATADDARRGLNAVYRPILRDVELALQDGATPQRRARFLARTLTVEPGALGQTRARGDVRGPLALLLGTTALVLLIACANVANLLLARGAARAGELSLRAALGASRARLAGLLLAESLLLAAAGGAAGLLVGRLTLAGLVRLLPPEGAAAVGTRPDGWTAAVAALVALGTGVAFGVAPALAASRPDLGGALRAAAGQVPGGSRGAARTRAWLVGAQIALSTALLASAALFARSLANVARERLGLDPERVVTFELAPERLGYSGPRSAALFADVERALAAEPGVSAVASARLGVLSGRESQANVSVQGYQAAPEENTDVYLNAVGPGFFRALGTPVLAGREFGAADRPGAARVVVVNDAFVRRFGLGRTAVGRRMARGAGNAVTLDREIVGVVADQKNGQVKGPVPPVVYLAAAQDTSLGTMTFYARTRLDPETLRRRVPALVARLDPGLPVGALKSLPAQIRENTGLDRLVAVLAGAFAGLALALAAVGLYGVLAYTAALRTRELGVRMALGATAAAVRRLVLGQVGRLLLAGGAAGLVAALALGRAARSLLYGVAPADPLALAAAATVVALVALAAGWVPAARAARTDPTRALRYE